MNYLKLKLVILINLMCGCALSITSNAQSSISGRVLNLYSQPMNKATVLIYVKETKNILQTSVTDTAGQFLFKDLAAGSYFIKVNFIGYQSINSEVFSVEKNKVDIGKLFLVPAELSLSEVVVEGKRKIIEQQDGKTVINLKSSAAAGGSSALDVLERLPNVSVNKQNNQIVLAGKEGSIVMINGKRTYMPNVALLQFLSGINASKIDKIELITNPSSSLDAEGNAGIINIIMDKSNEEGLTGTIEGQVGYGQGNIDNLNTDFAYARRKINLSLSYSFYRQSQLQSSFNSRENIRDNFYVSTNSNRSPIQRNHNARINIDYRLSEKATISAMFSAFDNKWTMNAVNQTIINSSNQPYNKLIASIDELNYWKHWGGALSFQQELSENRVLLVNVDYLHYNNENPAKYYTDFFDTMGNILPPTSARSTKKSPISIIVPQINYTAYAKNKINIQVGAKASFSRFDNLTSVERLSNGYWNEDPLLASQAKMRETIIGGFVEFNYKLSEKISVKSGIRYENTLFDLTGNVPANNLNRRYGNLFPSVAITKEFNDHNMLSIAYARRINRPAFTDIAPFVLFLDPYTLFTGNPAIQPSYTNSFSANYTLHSFIISTSYSSEVNSISKFQISVDPKTNTQLFRPENLGATKIINIGVTAPIQLTPWWTFQSSINGLMTNVNTGNFQNNQTLNNYGVQISSSQQFKFLKKNTAEISAFYNTIALSGTALIQPYGGIVLGIQRKMRNSLIRFNVNDIFNSIKYTALINAEGYNIRNGYDYSQPTCKLSYSYNFGTLKANNSKGRGAEEERKRVQ